jgi:hypothetical protein
LVIYFLFENLFKSCLDCLKEAFALFDSDRDGEITVEELGKVTFFSIYHKFRGDAFIITNKERIEISVYFLQIAYVSPEVLKKF